MKILAAIKTSVIICRQPYVKCKNKNIVFAIILKIKNMIYLTSVVNQMNDLSNI